MSLINCKVELKVEWAKHCVLAASYVGKKKFNSDSILFTIKDTKSYALVITLLAKDI